MKSDLRLMMNIARKIE